MTLQADDHSGEIHAAAAIGPQELIRVWRNLTQFDQSSPRAYTVARHLVDMAHPREALEVLEHAGDSVDVEQLRALAFAKCGDVDQAIQSLVTLKARLLSVESEDELDRAEYAETCGLLAGRYKQRFLKSERKADLMAAFSEYREAFERSNDTYPGINAAALAAQLGDAEEAQTLATRVLELTAAVEPSDMNKWLFATLGEAHLLLRNLDEAAKWYLRAVGSDPNAHESIATMRAQARRDLNALGLPADSLDDIIEVRSVVAYTGHRVDSPEQSIARFPREREKDVRLSIRSRLKELGGGYGFGSAACGADILFLEELLDRGGEATVFLPFPTDAFVDASVGPSWKRRFDKLLSDSRIRLEILRDDVPAEQDLDDAFAECNDAAQEAAIEFAKRLGEEPVLLAVWNRERGGKRGGTCDAVECWEGRGYDIEIIDVTPAASPTANPAHQRMDPNLGGGQSAINGPTENSRRIPEQNNGNELAAPGVAQAHPAARRGERQHETTDETDGPWRYTAKHCLCIGINSYAGDPWTQLRFARNDAQEVGRVLSELHDFETPLFLLDAEATRSNIARTIQNQLRKRVVNRERDLVVLFFAGHGHTMKLGGQQHGYIVPADARTDQPEDLVSVNQLTEWSTLLDCHHVLYIFDSCFSGMFQRMSGGDRMDAGVDRARIAITAGQADQTVYDGGADTAHSVFTDSLLNALQSAADQDADYTTFHLHLDIRNSVTSRYPEQTPTISFLRNHEGGEIVIRQRTA